MLLKMEKHVNACVSAILIAIDLRSERYMGWEGKEEGLRTE
jgi:hypothetical protein